MVVMVLFVNMLPRDPQNQKCDVMGMMDRRQTRETRTAGERFLDHNGSVSTESVF